MSYIRRRRYFVNSGFQLKFAFGFLIAALIGSVSSTALFNFLATIKLEQLQWSVHLSADSTGEALKQIFLYVNLFSLIFVPIIFGLTCFMMLKKINGPIYRLIKNLESIKSGDLSKAIVLRRKDEFGDVAKNLDDMKEQIRRRYTDSKRQYGEISLAIQEMESAVIKKEHIDEQLRKIVIMLQNIQKQNQ